MAVVYLRWWRRNFISCAVAEAPEIRRLTLTGDLHLLKVTKLYKHGQGN